LEIFAVFLFSRPLQELIAEVVDPAMTSWCPADPMLLKVFDQILINPIFPQKNGRKSLGAIEAFFAFLAQKMFHCVLAFIHDDLSLDYWEGQQKFGAKIEPSIEGFLRSGGAIRAKGAAHAS
jgi:hypothetical protein